MADDDHRTTTLRGFPARRAVLTAVLVLLSTGAVGLAEIGSLLATSAPMSAPEAIVVLGSHEWERLPLAARIARANPHAAVLLTTPVWVTEKNCYMCESRVEWLVHAGVTRPQIVLLAHKVRNTHDEAAAVFSYAATRGVRSVLVVTSPYHGRRALATFRTAFTGTPVRVGLQTALHESGARPGRWWMRAYDRWYVAYESAAMVMYVARYHVNPFLE